MRRRAYLKGLGLGIFVTALIMSLSSGKAKGGEMSDAEIMRRAAELGMVSENVMLLSQAQQLADDAAKSANLRAAAASSSQTGTSMNSVKSASANASTLSSDSASGSMTELSGATSAAAGDAKALDKEDSAATAGGGMASAGRSTTTTTSSSHTDTASTTSSNASASSSSSSIKAQEVTPASSEDVVVITISSGESSISVASKMAKAGLISDAGQFDSYLVLSGYDRKLVVGPHPIPKGATPAEMGAILTSKQ